MNADDAYALLSELRRQLDGLTEALTPGTRKPWAQRELSDNERERLDAEAFRDRAAREQNAKRGLSALGESPAPLRVGVVDAAAAVESGLVELERTVCAWLGLTPLAGASLADRIGRLVGLLDRIASLPELSGWFSREAARLVRIARHAVGDTPQIRRLDARCPICDCRSLRAIPEKEIVACTNADCTCTDEGCRCHRDPPQRHIWRHAQWPWLAQLLDQDLRAAS